MLSRADYENRTLGHRGPSLAASRLASTNQIKFTAPTRVRPPDQPVSTDTGELQFYAPVLLAANGGRTWGKQLLGVRVLRSDGTKIGFGRAFCRESLVKLLFSVFLFMWLLSVLWPLWQPQNKALHDLIVGTRAVEG
jgi:hypothetical protein